MAQLTYPTDLVIGIAGQAADTGAIDVISRASEEAVAFPYGCAVVAGTDPDVQALLASGAADLLGVAMHSHAAENDIAAADSVLDGRMFNVLRDGRIYVVVEEAVTPASTVFVRISAGGGGSQLGAFRASADTATALACAGARYLTSAGIAGVAVLEIDKGASIA